MTVVLARRDLFRGRLARPAKARGLRPPTAIEEERFLAACDGCAACAPACPETVIRHDGEHRPVLRFEHGECTFCGACADVCEAGALVRVGVRDWTAKAEISGKCLAIGGVHCRSCGDACPRSALRFQPRADGRFLPVVVEDACNGCGACVAPCPVDAVRVNERPEGRGEAA
ncbi:MAG: ferredoxin-type protein NapF [Phyllobacteriaceae bacterium]|nr:ferredoxin-type protein NapF [Phyllobacteriaceae bacterium]